MRPLARGRPIAALLFDAEVYQTRKDPRALIIGENIN